MAPSEKNRADTEAFVALALAKFQAFSVEDQIAMLKDHGIPADENTASYYFYQLIEIAIKRDMELLGAVWPDGPRPDLLKKG